MKRLDYEAPTMELIVVEMENGFLEASVVNTTKQSSVETTGHELNEIDSETVNSWNNEEWK